MRRRSGRIFFYRLDRINNGEKKEDGYANDKNKVSRCRKIRGHITVAVIAVVQFSGSACAGSRDTAGKSGKRCSEFRERTGGRSRGENDALRRHAYGKPGKWRSPGWALSAKWPLSSVYRRRTGNQGGVD